MPASAWIRWEAGNKTGGEREGEGGRTGQPGRAGQPGRMGRAGWGAGWGVGNMFEFDEWCCIFLLSFLKT